MDVTWAMCFVSSYFNTERLLFSRSEIQSSGIRKNCWNHLLKDQENATGIAWILFSLKPPWLTSWWIFSPGFLFTAFVFLIIYSSFFFFLVCFCFCFVCVVWFLLVIFAFSFFFFLFVSFSILRRKIFNLIWRNVEVGQARNNKTPASLQSMNKREKKKPIKVRKKKSSAP